MAKLILFFSALLLDVQSSSLQASEIELGHCKIDVDGYIKVQYEDSTNYNMSNLTGSVDIFVSSKSEPLMYEEYFEMGYQLIDSIGTENYFLRHMQFSNRDKSIKVNLIGIETEVTEVVVLSNDAQLILDTISDCVDLSEFVL